LEASIILLAKDRITSRVMGDELRYGEDMAKSMAEVKPEDDPVGSD